MACVFYAWEFGANLGHIGTFLPVAKRLRERGHAVSWGVAQPQQAARLLPQAGFEWLAAPTMPEQKRAGAPLNYADILLRCGYAAPDSLLGLVVAWRGLFSLTQAQVVVADHAPTAILAARTLGLPVMLFGGGFFCPPPQSPTPVMRAWQPMPQARLQALDDLALASINAVLAQLQQPPLRCIAELFAVAENTLLTFPELDHYEQRGPAKYWGNLPAAVAEPPCWPSTQNDTPPAQSETQPVPQRLFVYLRRELAHYTAALAALAQLADARAVHILIYIPDLDAATRARYTTPSVMFADGPVDLNQVAKDADAALTYASPAASCAFLLAGKPLLMLPGQLEQFVLARRVEQMGAGRLVNPEDAPGNLVARLTDILTHSVYRQNAQAFATKYAAFDQAKVEQNIALRIEELAP
jgi:UDP:flavonoid glycosyltransferase YjiC (YdhE family)